MDNPQIICIYCNTPWTEEMLQQLHFCEGSYTPECVSSKIGNTTDITCPVCHKVIYRKEVEEMMDMYDNERWGLTNI